MSVCDKSWPKPATASRIASRIAGGGGADLVDPAKGFGGFVKAERAKPWIAAVD